MGHLQVELVTCVSGEDVEVVVEGVLVAGGFVVLAEGDAMAIVSLFDGDGDFLGNFSDVMQDILG